MNQMINMAWNMAEWMGSQRRAEDVLWLYVGWLNDSIEFNILEYILMRLGLIK